MNFNLRHFQIPSVAKRQQLVTNRSTRYYIFIFIYSPQIQEIHERFIAILHGFSSPSYQYDFVIIIVFIFMFIPAVPNRYFVSLFKFKILMLTFCTYRMHGFLDRVQATPEKTGGSNETPSRELLVREIRVSGRPIPEEIMDDLCSRFLLNIPATEKDDMIRLMFQVELAHWFYIDFHRVEDPSLPEMRLPQFSGILLLCLNRNKIIIIARIFAAYPFLLKGNDNVSTLITKWREYKKEVPTYGAIIMDQKLSHCLLVQGNSEKSTWGFPKGKVSR